VKFAYELLDDFMAAVKKAEKDGIAVDKAAADKFARDLAAAMLCYGLDQYDWLELVSWGKDLVRRRCARRENDLDSDSEVGEL